MDACGQLAAHSKTAGRRSCVSHAGQGAVYSAHTREGLFLLLVKYCFKVGWWRVGFDVGHDLLGYLLRRLLQEQ